MGWAKKLKKRVSKTVKKVGEKVGVDKAAKAVSKVGKTAYALHAPFLGGLGLKPQHMGIKNSRYQGIYDKILKGGRIGVGALGAVAGGAALAGGATGAGSGFSPGLSSFVNVPGGGPGGSSLFGNIGMAKNVLAGGSMLAPLLSGGAMKNPNQGSSGPMPQGNFDWTPSSGMAYPGGSSSFNEGGPSLGGGYNPGSPESLQLAYLQKQLQVAGLSPELRAQRESKARESIRSAQADRGMFNSGLGMEQEALMMPEISARMDDADFSKYSQMFSQLDPMANRRFQSSENYADRAFRGNQADLDRIYGMQQQGNSLMFGRASQEDSQDFQSRLAYNNAFQNAMGALGGAGMNYFLR